MATRRDAREMVVQLLFQMDFSPQKPADAFPAFWAERPDADEATRAFVERLVCGVRAELPAIDAAIRQYAENWSLERIAVVDRNVMRMALYEMLYCPDIPPVVSINEAVDIVKYFSSSEAGRFVNGILDRARKDLKRPARSAGKP